MYVKRQGAEYSKCQGKDLAAIHIIISKVRFLKFFSSFFLKFFTQAGSFAPGCEDVDEGVAVAREDEELRHRQNEVPTYTGKELEQVLHPGM
jgi:hypothetical protein